MLKRLVEFIKNNHPESSVDEYLDAKYIQLSNEQLKKIAQALKSGEIENKDASSCKASHFIFHFGSTLILLKRNEIGGVYTAELSWETDFLSVRSVRDKAKGFYFINFEINNDYTTVLLDTQKTIKGHVNNAEKNQEILNKVMPVLKGFMQAISE
jgi:hypothetical protein